MKLLVLADPDEQKAIATMRKMRVKGSSLMAIRDALRGQGHQISHETVRAVLSSCRYFAVFSSRLRQRDTVCRVMMPVMSSSAVAERRERRTAFPGFNRAA